MNKPKLVLDFDSTIVDSVKAYCDAYTYLYRDLYNHSDFKLPDHTKNDKWDFSIECYLEKHPESIFSNKLFFDNLEFLPHAKEVIERLSHTFQIIICTIGSPKNIALKVLWIEEHLPTVKNVILIVNEGVKMSKNVVNMTSCTFIDDHQDNLFSSNAQRRILFNHNNKVLDWNKDWMGERVTSWLELEKLLLGS